MQNRIFFTKISRLNNVNNHSYTYMIRNYFNNEYLIYKKSQNYHIYLITKHEFNKCYKIYLNILLRRKKVFFNILVQNYIDNRLSDRSKNYLMLFLRFYFQEYF